jgi:histidinol-phosphatase (PHP family)
VARRGEPGAGVGLAATGDSTTAGDRVRVGTGILVGDYHTRSRFSDGEGDPAELVVRALALGLPAIGISDHCAPEVVAEEGGYGVERDRLGDYVAAVRDAARRCPEIRVLLALEADYVPGAEDELAALRSAYPFDYVIAGLHFVDGFSLDDPPSRRDRRWQDPGLYRRYYALVRRALETGSFDVLAHIDYISLWGHPLPGDIAAAEDDALAAVMEAGAALEVNTTGTLDFACRMYPRPGLLARARARGLPIVFGSDAHELRQVGWMFDEAVALARGAGCDTWRELPSRRERPFV